MILPCLSVAVQIHSFNPRYHAILFSIPEEIQSLVDAREECLCTMGHSFPSTIR